MTVVIPKPSRAARDAAINARHELERAARQGHQAVYVGGDTVLCRVLGKHMFYVDGKDRGLAPHLIMNGFWEPWITVAMQRFLRPGMICVDVGANLGYFTAVMADAVGPKGAVVAFEPNPRLLELLRASLFLNGHNGRVCAAQHAVADRDGDEVFLRFAESLPMNGTICPKNPSGEAVAVKTVTLDTACRRLPRIDLIKIDVEGAEQSVWDGMQGLLDAHPEAVVVLEWNARRGDAAGLLAKIERRFPNLAHLDFDGLVEPIDRDRLLHERGGEDFMLWLAGPMAAS
jgi:FkbM family methyltransferase